eukprot:scaffold321261_cov23-Tisochrysis_lutea.AAC.1
MHNPGCKPTCAAPSSAVVSWALRIQEVGSAGLTSLVFCPKQVRLGAACKGGGRGTSRSVSEQIFVGSISATWCLNVAGCRRECMQGSGRVDHMG